MRINSTPRFSRRITAAFAAVAGAALIATAVPLAGDRRSGALGCRRRELVSGRYQHPPS